MTAHLRKSLALPFALSITLAINAIGCCSAEDAGDDATTTSPSPVSPSTLALTFNDKSVNANTVYAFVEGSTVTLQLRDTAYSCKNILKEARQTIGFVNSPEVEIVAPNILSSSGTFTRTIARITADSPHTHIVLPEKDMAPMILKLQEDPNTVQPGQLLKGTLNIAYSDKDIAGRKVQATLKGKFSAHMCGAVHPKSNPPLKDLTLKIAGQSFSVASILAIPNKNGGHTVRLSTTPETCADRFSADVHLELVFEKTGKLQAVNFKGAALPSDFMTNLEHMSKDDIATTTATLENLDTKQDILLNATIKNKQHHYDIALQAKAVPVVRCKSK